MEKDTIAINTELWEQLQSDPTYKKQLNKIMKTELNELNPEFLGFVQFYYYLSLILPKNRTIYDLGCANAPQSYYFKDYKQYIGVDLLTNTNCRIRTPNSTHYKTSIDEYIKKHKIEECHFAFCCYVPPWRNDNEKLVREHFKHIFVYYPMNTLETHININNKITVGA